MKITVPVFVRRHPDGRFTLSIVDEAAEHLVAHAATRERAQADLAEALADRLSDPADPLRERLAAERAFELRRARVPLRLQRPSGRGAEVVLPVTWVLVTPAKPGPLDVHIPRLGLWREVESREDLEATVLEEIRAQLSGRPDAEVLARVPDAEETIEDVEVDVRGLRPRKRARPVAELGGELGRVGADLGANVRRGALAAAYERDMEVNRLLEMLAGTRPRSVLLVGDGGVGKTAIVTEAARRIALGEAAALKGTRIVQISGSRILAGMTYFGDWQERCRKIAEEAREGRFVLFVDDLAELCEAGRGAGSGGAGAAAFFARHAARGEIALIAEATRERLRRVERIDAAIPNLFTRMDIHELDRETSREVLRRAAGPLGRLHEVRIEPTAVDAAVDLTARFVPGRRFPGKALGLLSRAAANNMSERSFKITPVIDRERVIAAFTRETGLPEVIVRDEVALDRDALEKELSERVLEQPEAARAIADAVILAKAGLADPGKPVAVYLFAGPTGVGKTESARALAERLFGSADRLARFDMSEYQDPAGFLRLAGDDDREGELGKRVREQPFSVLLLDEIEKAHPAVFDLLLSVLGEGRLVDHGGRVADFRSAIVILTSNLGSGDASGIGFGASPHAAAERYISAARAFFRPELVNRLDRIVAFRPLPEAAIERLARRELDAILVREGLERRRIRVKIAPEVLAAVARAGFHPRYGARPLKRAIDRRILGPLSRWIVRRPAREDADIDLWLDGDEVRLAARERRTRPTLAGEFEGAAALRLRIAEARDSWAIRAAPTVDARLRQLADAPEIDGGELTRLELDLLAAAHRPGPLPELEVVEVAEALVPGAAAARVARSLAAWAASRGIGVTEEGEGARRVLRFADPAAAALLRTEIGEHVFGDDLDVEEPLGGRVRVGGGEAVVRRYAGKPKATGEDPRTGLIQPAPGAETDAATLERFLLGAWRRASA